jgi:predicted transcriptional regulator
MKNRRDRIDMIISILEAIEGEGKKAKPTHILYKANLSHKLMKRYLNELKNKGFIIENEDNKNIILTDTGIKFLSELRKMKRFIESFGL